MKHIEIDTTKYNIDNDEYAEYFLELEKIKEKIITKEILLNFLKENIDIEDKNVKGMEKLFIKISEKNKNDKIKSITRKNLEKKIKKFIKEPTDEYLNELKQIIFVPTEYFKKLKEYEIIKEQSKILNIIYKANLEMAIKIVLDYKNNLLNINKEKLEEIVFMLYDEFLKSLLKFRKEKASFTTFLYLRLKSKILNYIRKETKKRNNKMNNQKNDEYIKIKDLTKENVIDGLKRFNVLKILNITDCDINNINIKDFSLLLKKIINNEKNIKLCGKEYELNNPRLKILNYFLENCDENIIEDFISYTTNKKILVKIILEYYFLKKTTSDLIKSNFENYAENFDIIYTNNIEPEEEIIIEEYKDKILNRFYDEIFKYYVRTGKFKKGIINFLPKKKNGEIDLLKIKNKSKNTEIYKILDDWLKNNRSSEYSNLYHYFKRYLEKIIEEDKNFFNS